MKAQLKGLKEWTKTIYAFQSCTKHLMIQKLILYETVTVDLPELL
jgi:hypothetical protein